MANLKTVLQNYAISGEIINETRGPLLKIIEFEPAPGTKLKNITTALEDIRRELGTTSLRVEPAESSNAILFEFPAENFETVNFKQILNSAEFEKAKEKYALPICLGADIKGTPIFADLAKMPHLLIGGTTGSGKSVGLNTFMLSLISAKKPADLKFVLIDPKKIEFSVYNNQKYMMGPVITESTDAVKVLSWLAQEMDKRYDIFSENMSKNLAEYNEKGDGHLPYIVCVIDEFADLMAVDKSVEKDVMRLAQKARAAGIHLLLATQRPSVDVVTGVLKANFPTRLAYKMASRIDSQTILDMPGAEILIGRGDCLFLASDGNLKRLHGAYMPDEEIEELLKPLACSIKPWVFPEKIVEEGTSAGKQIVVKKENFIKRCWKGWCSLGTRKQQQIINIFKKYILPTILAWFAAKRNKRK
ncbi:MAG: DUF87 domain-containing protein [Alphaproteobacteria bacterium]|nr:DUF87 domain-containing protein [Alphaproteobacteria bacterium]